MNHELTLIENDVLDELINKATAKKQTKAKAVKKVTKKRGRPRKVK